MKRIVLMIAVTLFIGVLSGFAQLFPKVKKPTSPEMSMLAIQFGTVNNDKYETVINNNFTGWAPVVKDANGKVAEFRNFNAGAGDIASIYYAENLVAGEYTLIGFYHVYTDYGKLTAYRDSVKNPNYLPTYEPYVDKSFHIRQFFPLKMPVKITLAPNTIMSLGSFAVKYKWTEGMAGTSDTRWKMDESVTGVVMENPNDDKVIRYMKPWATPAWKKWNVKNPATPL